MFNTLYLSDTLPYLLKNREGEVFVYVIHYGLVTIQYVMDLLSHSGAVYVIFFFII